MPEKAVLSKKPAEPAAAQQAVAVSRIAEADMSTKRYKYLYGPVPSRRLGRSLGLDLVPFKTCTYDCIYCQLGRTTEKTVKRAHYVPVGNILDELKEALEAGSSPDYISIAGSGEPTLHAGIGELIAGIKQITNIPVACLTNGSLLFMPEVRQELSCADLVIPSLDAGDEQLFHYINRPHPDISFAEMVNGITEFTRSFSGEVRLEVFLLSGVTGITVEAKKIAACARQIDPDRVELNTVCRPTAEEFACAVSRRQMDNLALLFPGKVDVISDDKSESTREYSFQSAAGADIINLLARRPCTLAGICSGLGLHSQETVKKLKTLIDEKRIMTSYINHDIFYKISEKGRL